MFSGELQPQFWKPMYTRRVYRDEMDNVFLYGILGIIKQRVSEYFRQLRSG